MDLEVVAKAQYLTKRYHGVLAVDRIDLEVYRSEFFGLLGPNSAGKTTTIRMLTGQTKPTSGVAIVADYDIIHQPIKAKEHVGVVPEASNVYDEMSAWDNLIFAAELYGVPRKERNKRAKDLLERFGLYERRGDRVGNFSKGMKRRLTIAAALIHRPCIVFLDEPTTGLDVQSARIIRNLLKELNRSGVTIFLTTHYIEEADQLCQRIAIINQGRIVALDSPEKLKALVEERHVVEVSFSPAKDLDGQLKGLKHVSDVSWVGDRFRLYVEDASEVIPLLIDFGRENKLRIVSINTMKPSLEDAFVKITGLSPEVMATEKEHAKKGESLG
ncbi:ATP-binding cassette domain-containing protein [Candidatus Bathyarchaeota archaeon]|nr:ATP-binding cassette domain-containing protein [Candidatus Bathyarchaeota archaeon]MBS7630924.1 ATP-binding cassette domain-containing protein [Candidatus Bathyarchaeota archaeon]